MPTEIETTQVLRDAKALIGTPEKWTRGCFFRNAWKEDIDTLPPDLIKDERRFEPISWCASGAIIAIEGELDESVALQMLAEAMGVGNAPARDGRDCHIDDIATYQDNSFITHTDVMDKFDEAIVMAEEVADG